MTTTTRDESTIKMMLETIEAMLRDPSCVVEWNRGVIRYDGGRGYVEAKPSDGQTIVLKVSGGAVDMWL